MGKSERPSPGPHLTATTCTCSPRPCRTGDHAMTSVTTKPYSSQPAAETAGYLFDNWFDPIESGLRDRVREFMNAMIEGELDIALSRPRYRWEKLKERLETALRKAGR